MYIKLQRWQSCVHTTVRLHVEYAKNTCRSTPIKCGGAPQKIMYIAEDWWRRQNIRDRCDIKFFTGGAAIFPSPTYAEKLLEVCKSRDLRVHFQHELVELNPDTNEAIFMKGNERITIPYDIIHVTPPQSAPDFIKKSPLANQAGWVDVDKETTQHVKYSNVFALGDCSSLPTSKTAAAITKQAPITAKNVVSLLNGESIQNKYDGYTSCPLVTGRGKLIMAEFDYSLKPAQTFPFIDQSKERTDMYYVKKYVLPKLYWDFTLKGMWRP